MAEILHKVTLLLVLLSTVGFILYIIKQDEKFFRWGYIVLFTGFVFHTFFLAHQYYTLGTAPVISLKSTLSFFAWCIIGVYLFFQMRFGLLVLGSFVAPLAAVLMIISIAIPGMETTVSPMLKS